MAEKSISNGIGKVSGMTKAAMITTRRSELEARARDYLDDKLQTPADFEGLEALLQQAQDQQEVLKKQVGTNISSSRCSYC